MKKPVAPKPAAVAKVDPGIDWVRIPGGTFQMGSNDGEDNEKPVHTVRVSTFDLSRSEVTWGQYLACVSSGGCTEAHADDGICRVWDGSKWAEGVLPPSFRGSMQPVVCVDWEQASAYARWAGGRLATESEWEYAARGGEGYTYAGSNDLESVAWVDSNSGGTTHAVCGKKRNGFGLCDMTGNVWEWVADLAYSSYAGAPSGGSAWTSGGGSNRVYRGGGWGNYPPGARVALRYWGSPSRRIGDLGFRLARSIP